MNHEVKQILNKFGRLLIKKDFNSIASICAFWLQGFPLNNFAKSLEKQEAEVRSMFSDMKIGKVDSFELDYNDCNVDELRDDGVDLPQEIDHSVFMQWAIIGIKADKGKWGICDVYCAVIREGEYCRIGYLSVEDPD